MLVLIAALALSMASFTAASLSDLVLSWRIVDLEKHYLTWNSPDKKLRVYSAWKNKDEESFEWNTYAAVGRDCDKRTVENGVTKCQLEIGTRIGSNLALRLCRKGNFKKCRTFFINGDDDPRDKVLGFQDVKYTTELSKMTFTRNTTTETSIKLHSVTYPYPAACDYDGEYDLIQYVITAIEHEGGAEDTCKPSEVLKINLKKETFTKADPNEVCDDSGFDHNITGLKPGKRYCVYLQYKITYRGKTIDADIGYGGPIQTDGGIVEADESGLLILFIALSVFMFFLTLALARFCVRGKKKITIAKVEGEELAVILKKKLDVPIKESNYAKGKEISEKIDVLVDQVTRIERKIVEQVKLASNPASSVGSIATMPLIEENAPENEENKNPASTARAEDLESSAGDLEPPARDRTFIVDDSYIKKPMDDESRPPSYVISKDVSAQSSRNDALLLP